MELIKQWRKCHRRYSVYITASMPAIAMARDQLPQIREFLPPEVYGAVMVGLFVLFIAALNIKQKSMAVDKP
jgi:hypothetical protein